MDESGLVERLIQFGLTRQEALLYLTLAKSGELTGYEAAKETGISRSNVYSALAGLTEKGAAYVVEGTATKYVPVEVSEFCENTIRRLQGNADFLKSHMPKVQEETDGYITIQGFPHILDKIIHMMEHCEKRLYLVACPDFLENIREHLEKAVHKGIKTVIITNGEFTLAGAIVHYTEIEPGQVRFITDSAYVLTGEITGSSTDTCLYSGQKNLVTVFKEGLRNMITLIEIEERKKQK